MLCISIVQLAVLLTGPNEMDQELSKIQPPAKKVPPAENQEDQEDARDIADIANIRAIPAFEGFPINPVADAKLAVSFCSKNCPEIPKASFWDVPAPIMFERGSTCNSHGECDTKVPTHMAQEQYDSLARRLRVTSHTRIAIVGSSGSLKWGNSSHAPYGPEIDSHDIVVRINGAPAGGKYKGWVGEKTHVAYAAPEGLEKVSGKYQAPLQAVVFQSFGICASDEKRQQQADWARKQLAPGTVTGRPERARRADSALQRFYGGDKETLSAASELASAQTSVWTVDPDWGCALWRDELGRANSYFPSTGMNAVGFFASLAKSLGAPPPSVYGYGGDTRGCEKYYDCFSKGIDYDANNWHPFNAEHRALSRWSKAGHIARVA